MAPLKPVRSLADIAQAATCDFIIDSCMKIEERSSPGLKELCLNFDRNSCEDEVQKLQDLLKKRIPPPMWDSLFQAVMDHPRRYEIHDQRILFGSLIYNNVNLKTLTIGYSIANVHNILTTKEEYYSNVRTRPHVKFWLQRVPMLTRLSEVDLTDVANVEIVTAFTNTCKDLEIVTLPSYPSESFLDQMSTRKLRKLICEDDEPRQGRSIAHALKLFENLEDVYLGKNKEDVKSYLQGVLAEGRKLNLRNMYWTYDFTPESCQYFIDLCPKLEWIEDVILLHSDGLEIIPMLTASSVRLNNVSFVVKRRPRKFHTFLTVKGKFLTELEIWEFNAESPYSLINLIGDTCPNLVSLRIGANFILTDGQPFSPQAKSTCPKLQHLWISDISLDSYNFMLLDKCLANFNNLTHLTLSEISEESLMEIINTNARMQQITMLELVYDKGTFDCTFQLLVHIFCRCTNLTVLKVESPDTDVQEYIDILNEGIESSNLDFNFIFEYLAEYDTDPSSEDSSSGSDADDEGEVDSSSDDSSASSDTDDEGEV